MSFNRPFPANEVQFRVMTKNQKGATIVPFIDARQVFDRLIETKQSYKVRTAHIATTHVGRDDSKGRALFHTVYNATITFDDLRVTSSGTGEAVDPIDPSNGLPKLHKSAESDAIKRAAIGFGIGRELYDGPFLWLPTEKLDKYGGITKEGETEVRKKWAAYVKKLGDAATSSSPTRDTQNTSPAASPELLTADEVKAICEKHGLLENTEAKKKIWGFAQDGGSLEKTDEYAAGFRQVGIPEFAEEFDAREVPAS